MLNKIVSGIFSTFIILWAILNLLLILGTSHSYDSIDLDYWFVAILSLVIFPLTITLLFSSFSRTNSRKSKLFTISLLIITSIIFAYYVIELWTDEYSAGLNFYHYLPILAILTDFWLIGRIIKTGNNS